MDQEVKINIVYVGLQGTFHIIHVQVSVLQLFHDLAHFETFNTKQFKIMHKT